MKPDTAVSPYALDAQAKHLQKLPVLLLDWYQQNKRDLVWRGADAYGVLVSEIMLQQTRADTVRPYYLRFIKALPTVYDLARCDDEPLYKLWEGLGYYSRVKNLRAAAQKIVADFNGRVPDTLSDLLLLSGVGAYTAGAVASIAYGKKTAAVDGNVLRVVGRFAELYFSIADLKYRAALTAALSAVYPQNHCAEFTQSLMELGALICLPGTAFKCAECPLKTECKANKHATAAKLPVKGEKLLRREEYLTVFVLRHGEALAVLKRASSGLLSSLYELPNVPKNLIESEASTYLAQRGLTATGPILVRHTKHIFTHITWHMRIYEMPVQTNGQDGFIWASPDDLAGKITLPTAFKKCIF